MSDEIPDSVSMDDLVETRRRLRLALAAIDAAQVTLRVPAHQRRVQPQRLIRMINEEIGSRTANQ